MRVDSALKPLPRTGHNFIMSRNKNIVWVLRIVYLPFRSLFKDLFLDEPDTILLDPLKI